MSKKILILEPSQTTQSLIVTKLQKTEFEAAFETNGIKFLIQIYNTMPEAVLINAKTVSPKSSELIRLIKNVEKFKKIPVGVYATNDFSFQPTFMKTTGTDLFIHFETDSIPAKINELLAIAKTGKLAIPLENDIIKTGIAEKIFSYMKNLEDLKALAADFLNLLTEFCDVPAVSLFLSEEDGASAYYMCASNFSEGETSDFLKVSTSDFEQIFPNTNVLMITPEKLECENEIEKYHSGDIPLSAFQCLKIISTQGKPIGTVNVVREGAFTTHQLDLLIFCVHFFSSLIENAILMNRKIKFEKNIRRAFSRFVPEQIIDELVTETSSTDSENEADKSTVGEKRDVAILFCDIRSFTSISEINKPETIVAFLNRYFTTMCTIIKKHGGTVDKFIGDCIMALFGAPVSYEDNSRRAVQAAYEMREALATIPLEDLILPEGMTFTAGTGIHYGDVIVGSIGSSDKTDYSVIGDNVNLASRMEGLTKVYGASILVSDAVKKDIYKTSNGKDSFEFRYLDDVKVKGKEKAVQIYSIDRNSEEYSATYKDSYKKGLELYKNGTWNLAREYFERALQELPEDRASKAMLARCVEFEQNPPANWDGAITFHTK